MVVTAIATAYFYCSNVTPIVSTKIAGCSDVPYIPLIVSHSSIWFVVRSGGTTYASHFCNFRLS